MDCSSGWFAGGLADQPAGLESSEAARENTRQFEAEINRITGSKRTGLAAVA